MAFLQLVLSRGPAHFFPEFKPWMISENPLANAVSVFRFLGCLIQFQTQTVHGGVKTPQRFQVKPVAKPRYTNGNQCHNYQRSKSIVAVHGEISRAAAGASFGSSAIPFASFLVSLIDPFSGTSSAADIFLSDLAGLATGGVRVYEAGERERT